MSAIATAIVGTAVVGGYIQGEAAEDSAAAHERAGQAGIEEQRAARESFEERTDPFREVGLGGANQLTSFLEDPMQQLEEINPLVSFLRDQGFEQIQESAAARGRLGAGGTLEDLTRFNLDLSSTVAPQLQNQRFNQLFNTATMGANVAAGQGTAGLQTASNIGNLLGNIGQAQAGESIGKANAYTGALQSLSGAAGAFGGGGGVPTTVTPNAGGWSTGATISPTKIGAF